MENQKSLKEEIKPESQKQSGFLLSRRYASLGLFLLIFLLASNAYASEPDWDKIVPIIMKIESSGNPYAISKAGCIGLMQINPNVVKEWNNDYKERSADGKYLNQGQLFDPRINVEVGTWYLKHIWLDYFKNKGTIDDMLICYNWGFGNWQKYKHGSKKLPKETRDYLKKFHKLYREVEK